MLTGTGVDNREIGVNRNRSGETAHEVDLHESPQCRAWQRDPGTREKDVKEKQCPQPFLELLVGISETQSYKGSISGHFMLKLNSW